MSAFSSLLAFGVGAGVLAGVLILAVILVAAAHNGLVSRRMHVRAAWAEIDAQLKRRHNLIPNLIETMKGYAGREKDALERVLAARNQAASAAGVMQAATAENMLSGALRQLFDLSEAYPDLKANTNFQQLSQELTSTENKISFARQFYNNCVDAYNEAIQIFPNILFAGLFGFRPEEFYELDEDKAREVPQVKF